MLLQPAMVSGVGLRKDVNANAVGVIYGYLETIVKISIVENRPEKKHIAELLAESIGEAGRNTRYMPGMRTTIVGGLARIRQPPAHPMCLTDEKRAYMNVSKTNRDSGTQLIIYAGWCQVSNNSSACTRIV